MTSSFFSADDIAIGTNNCMITMGDRRLLLERLTHDEIASLHRLSHEQVIPNTLSHRLVSTLQAHSLIANYSNPRKIHPFTISSSTVMTIARILSPPASPKMLTISAAAVALCWIGISFRPYVILNADVSKFSPAQALLAAVLFVLTLFAHELGHAAACYRMTGLVGCIRGKLHMGLPALAIDLTPITVKGPMSRMTVTAAGPVWQVIASTGLMIINTPESVTAGTYSLLLALAALLPLPGLDGFWLLRAVTRSEMTGPLRLPRAGDIAGPAYCAALLLAITAAAAFTLPHLPDLFPAIAAPQWPSTTKGYLALACDILAMWLLATFTAKSLAHILLSPHEKVPS